MGGIAVLGGGGCCVSIISGFGAKVALKLFVHQARSSFRTGLGQQGLAGQ